MKIFMVSRVMQNTRECRKWHKQQQESKPAMEQTCEKSLRAYKENILAILKLANWD